MKKFILSGGPGAGKTTVLDYLKEKGYLTVEEVGRNIIQEEVKCGGEALPWKNKDAFTLRMLEETILSYENVMKDSKEEIVFFDRGIIDVLGYAKLESLKIDEKLLKAVIDYPFEKTVFLFPPWEQIYCQDKERKQDFAEAKRTYEVMKETYLEYGYAVEEVPLISFEKRGGWILSHLTKIF